MTVEGPGSAFVKVADGPVGTERLRAEADLLRRAAHPGVVQVQESGPGPTGAWILRLVRIPRGDLTVQGSWSLEEVAGYGAAVATTVADLHDLGIVHRRLTPDHLLVDDGGRPVLCGFSQAVTTDGPRTPAQKAEDTAMLARSIRDLLPSPPPRRVGRILDRAVGGEHRRPLSSRQLATALTIAVPAGRLPAPEPMPLTASLAHPSQSPTPTPTPAAPTPAAPTAPSARSLHPRHPRGRVKGQHALTAAAVAVSSLGWVLAATHHSSTARDPTTGRATSGAPGPSCPAADDGCGAVRLTGSTLSTAAGRFRLDARRDIMVLGRWACGGTALPALLQPATGQVWVFLRWATPSRPSTAYPVGTFLGARSLRVLPATGGCDRLAVVGPAGRAVMIRLPRS
jgi:hypothetical protein